ncbi:MAG: hypothetical protein D8M58_16390 [Calditrichaeota bacterium]|nr:MAG: hypothetical protein DWQ03_08120 [Calditrichota bacterium]MBL1206986.1 hypothetical protein [Calditrichota bacterium]NOG46813.1 hypothetical protein [Calditrichota bacterium]
MSESIKNIIIVGYPKSGTTWLTRLVADLLQCPIKGNWGFDDPDQPIIEGADRESEFACYKSHHIYDELNQVSTGSIFKIIYLIRDPRDVVVSGTNFFAHDYNLRGIKAILSKMYNLVKGTKTVKEQMVQAVLKGNESLDKWCKVSWQKHYLPYHSNKALFVQFEKLVADPIDECSAILNYLSLNKTDMEIQETINRQSFKNKKNQASITNDRFENHLLRKGRYGYWRKEFNRKQKQLFLDYLKNDLLFKKLYLDGA